MSHMVGSALIIAGSVVQFSQVETVSTKARFCMRVCEKLFHAIQSIVTY